MKKLTLVLVAILFAVTGIFAQTPNQFKYQAVLRDADGTIMTDENASVYLEILQGSISGTSVFDETHNVTTTAQGLINIDIGSEKDMSVVDWSADIYFIKITVNGTEMGTSQLLSVPYALHAETAETAINDDVDDADADPENELITEAVLNGNDLEITEAGEINIVDLSTFASPWLESGSDIYYDGGNVGIGTTSPVALLHIANDAGTETWALKTSGAANQVGGFVCNSSGKIQMLMYDATAKINLNTDGNSYLNGGNVGIGTTNPAALLEIAAETNTDKWLLKTRGNDTQVGGFYCNPDGKIQMFMYDGTAKINLNTDGNSYLNGGNVGIGTTNPAALLEIAAETNTDKWLLKTRGNDTQVGGFYCNPDGKIQMFMYDGTAKINLSTDGNSYLNGGNVGIGTTNPNYKLDVSGNVNTTGSYLTNGSDFAEYFVNEEELSAGNIAGINLETGKVRKYQIGDELVGIVSDDAGYVGNNALDREKDLDYTLVGLSGQLEFDESQVIIENRVVKTKDGIKIGVLLANGKVFIR